MTDATVLRPTDLLRGAGLRVTRPRLAVMAALERHRQEWSELAGRAIEANVFYEPEMLLPALRDLQPSPGWLVLLIHQGGRLIGLVEGYRTARVSFKGDSTARYIDVPVPGETYVVPLADVRRFLTDSGHAGLTGLRPAIAAPPR